MMKIDVTRAMNNIPTIEYANGYLMANLIDAATAIAENGEISNGDLCAKMGKTVVQTYIRALEMAGMIREEVREEETICVKQWVSVDKNGNPVPAYIEKQFGGALINVPNPDFAYSEQRTREIKVRRKYYVWLG